MAGKRDNDPQTSDGPPTASEADRKRALKWFEKANDLRERRDYDYAIECYITGLGSWPEAVEEGHMPLRSLAIQRQQVGGKKPGLMDGMRKPMTGKDALKAMLNAEQLLAMDPANSSYADGVLKNAARAGYLETVKWVAPLVLESLKKEKKPSKGRLKAFRETLIAAAAQAETWGNNALETWLLEKAVESLEYAIARLPADAELRDEQRDLAGKLTIARGRYENAEDFRDSLQDAESQKLLHDADRAQQGDDTLDALIKAARRKYEEAPDVAANFNRYIDALVKNERKVHEDEAIDVLLKTYTRTKTYDLKRRADDIRLRQLAREVRRLVDQARKTGTDEDKQQARLAAMEQRQYELDVFRERVEKYPTDLRLKYKLGTALFNSGAYDEAIPVLQEAQADPRNRSRAQLVIGRSFFERGSPGQAVEVLREAIEKYELTDEHSKELLYWLGRAYEAADNAEEAKAAYGKLLRQDYNYRDGDARKRLDALK